MKPEEVARGYDQIAKFWAGDSFPKENGISQHQRAIAFLSERRNALDIGCGSSGRLIELFLTHGFIVEGIDLSEQMLSLARARHPNVTLHHADICQWPMPRKYDLISAWDSIWHVPLSEQQQVMTKIVESLQPGGVFIFTTGGVDKPSEKIDTSMGPRMYYSVLGIPKLLSLLEDLGCVCRHLEYDQYPEQHVYVIAQKA